jgi:hypothetical protein
VRDDGRQEIDKENQTNKEDAFGLFHDSSGRDIVEEAALNAALTLRALTASGPEEGL